MSNDDYDIVQATKVIAMAIRNEMESLHGGDIEDSLTDEQMAKINPIVRNATASALHAMHVCDVMDVHWAEAEDTADLVPAPALVFLLFQRTMIPAYWEEPQLTTDYRAMWEASDESCLRTLGYLMALLDAQQR